MRRYSNIAAVVIALVVIALLACSPQVVVQEIFGLNSGGTATVVAYVTTPTRQPTTTPVVTLTAAPTATSSPAPTVAAPPAQSPTVPSTLPVRTDLPALALRDWPRPANDNGRCIHFLADRINYTPRDFEIQIPRV